MKTKFIKIALAVSIIMSLAACGSKSETVGQDVRESGEKIVVMLVDFSSSTAAQRAERLDGNIKTFLDVLGHGDTVVVSEIVDDSIQNAEVIFEKKLPSLPRPEFNEIDNNLVRAAKCEEFKERLAQFKERNSLGDFRAEILESIRSHEHEAPATDIFGALEFAERFFTDEYDEKILALFSDMVVETEKVSFTSDRLEPERIEQIIADERSERGIAALAGVDVFVIGAKAQQFSEVREFWFKYLAAAQANVDEKFYGNALSATLLNSYTTADPEIICD